MDHALRVHAAAMRSNALVRSLIVCVLAGTARCASVGAPSVGLRVRTGTASQARECATPIVPEPAPPRQRIPWSTAALTDVPRTWIDATRAVFLDGLADPRGGEYRDVDLATGRLTEVGATVVHTRAFVFSTESGAMAVAWNGGVYQPLSIGAPANVEEDGARPLTITSDDLFETDEARSVRVESRSILAIPLLLRIGRADAAVSLIRSLAVRDPRLTLERAMASTIFHRAVCAHVREEHVLARTLFEQLQALRPRLDPLGRTGDHSFAFLEPVEALRVDEQRRAAHPMERFAFGSLDSMRDPSARITALIAALDQVGPGLSPDAMRDAFNHEGPVVLLPLIDALEHDERLTRLVVRDPSRGLLSVARAADVAYAALFDMLLIPLHRTPPTRWEEARTNPTDRRAFAERLRGYVPLMP